MIRLIPLLLLACTTQRYHTAMVTEVTGVIVCDYFQTRWASGGEWHWDRLVGNGNLYAEKNPLLGLRPSGTTIAFASGSAVLLTLAIYTLPLPNWFKTTYFTGVGLVETANVSKQNHHGICGL